MERNTFKKATLRTQQTYTDVPSTLRRQCGSTELGGFFSEKIQEFHKAHLPVHFWCNTMEEEYLLYSDSFADFYTHSLF